MSCRLILATSLLCASSASLAQESFDDSRSGWGFAAGATSGSGIAYRKQFEGPWGLQTAGLIFGDRYNINANLGVHALYNMHEGERLRFYSLAGMAWGQSYDRADADDAWRSSGDLRLGAGLGMEFLLIDGQLGFSLDLPLTLFLDDDEGDFGFSGIYPLPTAALVYYF